MLAMPARAEDVTVDGMPRVDDDRVGIDVDGKLDEDVWRTAKVVTALLVADPDTMAQPRWPTEVLLLHSERGMYVGVRATQPADTRVARTSARDQFLSRDGFQIILDSSGDGRYGYWFSIYLGDSIGDGTVLPERDFQRSWDGAWHGNTAITDSGWSGEMFLPWSMLSMPKADGERRLGVHVTRFVAGINERWAWPAIPSGSQRFLSAVQPFRIDGVDPPAEFSIFPYLSGAIERQRDRRDQRAGADVFWRPSSNLQLTAALLPDFGQVEVDDVVVNLSAFETFFPEKRLFFIEGQEIFVTNTRGNFDSPLTLLNTRRIGAAVGTRRGAPDNATGLSLDAFERVQPVELLYATKVTGQSGNLRYGILGAAEDDQRIDLASGSLTPAGADHINAAGRDFGVLRLLYESTGDGRRALGVMSTLTAHPNRRAASHGIDAHWLSASGKTTFDAQWLMSDVEGQSGYGFLGDLRYSPARGQSHRFSFDYFDRGIDINDLGFLRRNDIVGAGYGYARNDPGRGALRERRTFIGTRADFNQDGRRIGSFAFGNQSFDFGQRGQVSYQLNYSFPQWDDRSAFGAGTFRTDGRFNGDLGWKSDQSRQWVFSTGIDLSQETIDGLRRRYRLDVTYRPLPSLSARVQVRYTQRDGWLLYQGNRQFATFETTEWQPGLQLEAFISSRQQLQLNVDWVGIKAYEDDALQLSATEGELQPGARAAGATARDFAVSDVNLQLRYRYELAPLSDLFVVYNRGGRLPNPRLTGFNDLFADTFSDPFAETLVVKVRYRFGT